MTSLTVPRYRVAFSTDVARSLPGACGRVYYCSMVDSALLEQVMKLDTNSRLELRDAIEASVVSEYLTPELANLLVERVAEDDAANHDDYISLEELERETLTRRAKHTA